MWSCYSSSQYEHVTMRCDKDDEWTKQNERDTMTTRCKR